MKTVRNLSFVFLVVAASVLSTSPLTAADPAKIADIGAVDQASSPTEIKGVVYFPVLSSAKNADGTLVYSGALWSTNGTAAGTTKVKDFGVDTSIMEIATIKGMAYLVVSVTTRNADGSSTIGEVLYLSDGTGKGTVKLMDFGAGSTVGYLSPLKNMIAFSVTTTKTNPDGSTTATSALWTTTGIATGTQTVKDTAADLTITGATQAKGVLNFTVKAVTTNADGSKSAVFSVWKYQP